MLFKTDCRKRRLHGVHTYTYTIFEAVPNQHLRLHLAEVKFLGPLSVSSQGQVLSHLVLSKNELAEVPSEALKHLRNLVHLNLNDNNITVLRKEAFLGLSKVSND